MNTLDRYIFRTFLKSFVGGLVVFSIMIVVIDFFSRLSTFTQTAGRTAGTAAEEYTGIEAVLRFYLIYLPFLLKEILPFVTATAGLFTLATLQRSNEVMPALAAGISGRRLFLPVFVAGAAIAFGHLLFQEYVVPSLTREQIALKRLFFGERKEAIAGIPHLRDGRGNVVRVGSYRFRDQRLGEVVIQRPWRAEGFETWTARSLVPRGGAWEAPDGVSVQPAAAGSAPEMLPPGSVVDFGVTASDVEALVSKQGTEELSLAQIRALSRKFPARASLEVTLHKQISRPLSNLILLMVGIPVMLLVGRSLFLGAALAFFLSGTYFFTDIFYTSLGGRGDLPPVVAAWLPNAFFGALGVALLARMRT